MPKFKVWNPEDDNLSGASEFECDEAEEAAEKYMQNNIPDPDDDHDHTSLMVMDEDGVCSSVDVDIEWVPSFYCGEVPAPHGFDVIVNGEGRHGADIYSWKSHDGVSGASFSSFEDAQKDGQRHMLDAATATC